MAENSGPNFDELADQFNKSCNVGVTAKQTQKTSITTSNVNRWFKQCNIYGPKLTSGGVDNLFMKCKTDKKAKELNFKEFKQLLQEATKDYKADKKLGSEADAQAAMIEKLKPGISVKGTTTSKTGGVGKLTDTSKYTGSHKERFDDSGKGKGAAGRNDQTTTTGYVGAYKGEGTYKK